MTPKELIDTIEKAHRLLPGSILGRRRNKELVIWRHFAMFACWRAFPEMTASALAKLFGRDRATIGYAVRRIENGEFSHDSCSIL